MSQIHFAPASPSHASAIVDFQIRMAWETEKLRLYRPTCERGVAAVFERPHLGKYHVCLQDSRVVASLLITTEWSDWRNGTVWWIQSVFVEPEFRGKGLFRKFYAYTKDLVEADPDVRGLRLYVERANLPAQAVYSKIGMNGNHYSLFEWMKTF